MKREQALRRTLRSLSVLGDVVNAMKSLSAHHVRAARTGLADAREYRAGIDSMLAAAGLAQLASNGRPPAVLLVATDLGLCNGYTARLTEAALTKYRQLSAGTFYCVGHRPVGTVQRAGLTVARTYSTVTSTGALPGLLLKLADDVLGDYLDGVFGALHVVSARFDGIGAFTARSTRILPMTPFHSSIRKSATPYASAVHLAETVIREYVYSTVFELLLDALASEHGVRLIATQSAGEWLETRAAGVRAQLASARREASTQEVLDLVAGGRHRRVAKRGTS